MTDHDTARRHSEDAVGEARADTREVRELKIWPQPFQAVRDGRKRAEYRDVRDWPVLPMVGDKLLLREWLPNSRLYTGNSLAVTVTHVQAGFGIPEGFAMLSIERASDV